MGIIAVGRDYRVLDTTQRTYVDSGSVLQRGQVFTASETSTTNEDLTLGMMRGEIVEVLSGTVAEQEARNLELQTLLRNYSYSHSGNGVLQTIVSQAAQEQELHDSDDSDYGITIAALAAGATHVIGTVATAGYFQLVKNGALLGTVFHVTPAGAYDQTVSALAGGQVIGIYAVDNSTGEILSDTVSATVVFATPVISTTPTTATTTVAGTAVAADGSTVTLYQGATPIGTGTVSSNAWSIASLHLVGTWSLTARTGNSAASTAVIVKFQAPVLTDNTYTAAGTSVTGTSPDPVDTIITVFRGGSTSMGTTTVKADGSWTKTGLTLVGNYSLTAKAGLTTAQSAASTAVVVHYDAPVVTDSTYTAASTSVTGTSDAADGTAVNVYLNGGSSAGSSTVSSNTWTVSGLTLVGADSITAKIGSGANLSAASTAVITHFKAPTISVPVNAIATTVVVTSSPAAANGTAVTVIRSGTTIGTGVVAGGGGSCTVTLTASLAGNDTLTAKHGTGTSLSAASSTIQVHFDAPVITSAPAAASTSVSGTSTAVNGTAVHLIRSASIIGTGAVAGGAGAWTITGLTLSAADSLTAKVGATGGAGESAASAPVVVTA